MLDAVDFGVPQTRRRLFVLCDRDQEPPAVKPRKRKHRNAAGVIKLDSRWPSRPLYIDNRVNPTLERAERAIDALGKGVPFLIVYYGDPSQRLGCGFQFFF